MNYKKCLYSLLALGLTAALASAQDPQVKVQKHGPKEEVEGNEATFEYRGNFPQQQLNFGVVQSTQFDTSEGWDLGHQVCGDDFAGLNAQGNRCCVQGAVTDVCIAKDHCTNQNCCVDDPNVNTGWYMNVFAKHCNEPHIDNVHPSQTKGPGSQHLRFVTVPATGNVVCAAPAFIGATCRFRFNTPTDRYPGNGQSLLGRSVMSYEIAISQAIGNTRMRVIPGFATEAPGGGSIYLYGVLGMAGIYFNPTGNVQACRDAGCADTPAGRAFLGYWKYDGGEYGKVTVDMDRCNNILKVSYTNSAAAVPPNIPGATRTLISPFLLWTPPYGDLAGPDVYNIIDTHVVQKNNAPGDNTKVDLDNWKIVHTPCPSACCLKDGTCNESTPETACTAANGKYYPNVACAQLGKGQCLSGANLLGLCASDADCPPTTAGNPNGNCYLWYPPACSVAKGACCNSGPDAGGACTDGVAEADCQGPAGNPEWRTWTKGATCDQAGYTTACNIGQGVCSSSYAGHAAPHFCLNKPGFEPCTTAADCDVPGFCYNGTCSPAAIPGHCVYTSPASAGYCQTMGRCSGSPDCNPDTGAGCCDPSCGPPVNCPAGQTCLQQPQDCDAIPSGADCAFCEGCSAWPAHTTVGCVTAADCPAADGVPGATVTCAPNTAVPCNADEDCPDLRTCIVPPYSPGGRVCTASSQCGVPAAPPCDETPGACCEQVKGTCEDDVLSADCPVGTAAQNVWTKGATCAEVEAAGLCEADLGACCDEDTFGSCTITTANGCNCIKCVFHKEQECADIECVHAAIPTVSEWGIVVLTLLLLVGAKVYFGRRQAATA